ncbi:hypothetical protein ACG04R_09350 [Roseateles sp. BYS78W]|uniref:Uncharacterized protein n=1 Tax=Pelomonas candidula TaxID=3299025 RepID=A0ABW7HBM0_9BURK
MVLTFALFLFVGLFVASIISIDSVWMPPAAAVFAFLMCLKCCVSKPAQARRSAARRSATGTAHRSNGTATDDGHATGIGAFGGMAAGVGVGAAVASFSAFSDDTGLSPHASFGDPLEGSSAPSFTSINPATGLPMIDDSGVGFDVGGNLYGTSSATDSFSSDSFGSSMDFGSASYDSGSSSGSFSSDPW